VSTVSFLGKRVIVHHQNYEGWEGQIIGLEKNLWLIALDQAPAGSDTGLEATGMPTA
jgi:hypothetical protein